MAPNYQPFGALLLVACLSLFWGGISCLYLIWKIIKVGTTGVFFVKKRTRPPILDDPVHGQHGFLSLTHDPDCQPLKIHYVSNNAAGKPLMLFLHGFPEFWYSWKHQMKEFGKDYRTVAIDMRGYSESDAPRGIWQYTMEKLVADVKEVITQLGYKAAVIVSHDWGAAVAWSFTDRHPDLVDRLVVCNVGHNRAFVKRLNTSWSQIFRSWYMFMFQLPYLAETILKSQDLEVLARILNDPFVVGAKAGTFTEEDINAYKYAASLPGRLTASINYYRAALRFAAPKLSKCIKPPTLVVWGTNDRALDKELAELSGMYCQDFTLQWVPGACHFVQQEEHLIVNKHIREFLEEKGSK